MRVRAKLYAFDDTLAMMSHNFAQRGWRMEMMSDHAADLPARVARWIAGGETYGVEFEGEQRERLNDRDLVEAVVCLANGTGGVLLVGVEDDGTVSGARPRHEAGRTDPPRVQALIANMTQPALSAVAGVVQVEGEEVLVVEVPDSPRVVGTTRGTYVRRAIAGDGRPTCVPYHAHEMLAHEVDRGAVDWAGLRIGGATWADLDPLEFERLRRLTTTAGDRSDRLLASLSDREIASALGLMRTETEVRLGTGRRNCSSGCSAWRSPPIPRRHSVRRLPMRSSTGTTRSVVPCTCSGARNNWRSPALGASRAAYDWTTCSSRHRIHAAHCWRMRSSAPALSSEQGAGSTGCSPSNSGSAGRHLTTGEAPTPMS